MKNVKKYLLLLVALFLISGCDNMMNTPNKKVEQFLSKYQTMDEEVLKQLDEVMDDAGNFTENQIDKYRNLMKKQYQNLSYKIKDETEDGNAAIVEVEIEVYDYGKAISEAETYLTTNKQEFINTETNEVDTEKFLDYKISKMEEMKDKITYTINFNLTKENDKWQLNDISDVDRQKLHGLYY